MSIKKSMFVGILFGLFAVLVLVLVIWKGEEGVQDVKSFVRSITYPARQKMISDLYYYGNASGEQMKEVTDKCEKFGGKIINTGCGIAACSGKCALPNPMGGRKCANSSECGNGKCLLKESEWNVDCVSEPPSDSSGYTVLKCDGKELEGECELFPLENCESGYEYLGKFGSEYRIKHFSNGCTL